MCKFTASTSTFKQGTCIFLRFALVLNGILKSQRHSCREETQCKSESNPIRARAITDYLEADPLRVQWALKFIFHIRRTIGSLCHLRTRMLAHTKHVCARLLLQSRCSNCFAGQRLVLAAICQSVGHEPNPL